jgi:dienelactone hydrolase
MVGLPPLNKGNAGMRTCFLAFFTFVLLGSLSAHSQDRDNAMAPDLVAAAQVFVDLLATRDFASAERSFNATMHTALPQEKLQETWNTILAQAGAFKHQVRTRTEEQSGAKVVIVTCAFEKAALDIQVGFDQAQRIAGLFFAPAQTTTAYAPPSYVQPHAFRETEVTVGTGEWALAGTLTVPMGPSVCPAVLLVHGSGPHDRDETVGANKPFRDLAWGLASQGIAVLRYEKRTKQHAATLGAIGGPWTVQEETIDDVLAAVALLRQTEGIEATRIFVLGHSLGGMLMPRIGTRDAPIAGFIVLAGLTRPLEDTILEQTIYLVSLEGSISKEKQAHLDEITKQVVHVKSLGPSDVNSSLRLFGAPVSYWLDLRGYDPPAAAKALQQPVLILQGERDYQVTMDDFHRWKAALSSQPNVTFRSYAPLNHLFIEGNGKSSPAEYNRPGHVAEVVINDIAHWIKK